MIFYALRYHNKDLAKIREDGYWPTYFFGGPKGWSMVDPSNLARALLAAQQFPSASAARTEATTFVGDLKKWIEVVEVELQQ